MSTTPATPAPVFDVIGGDEPLSDAAISALASLLLSLDDQAQGETHANPDPE